MTNTEPVAVEVEQPVMVEGELITPAQAAGKMIPWWVRGLLYIITPGIAAVYGVAEANTNIPWGWTAAMLAYMGIQGTIAAANTTRS
jgi:hypothetical protein